MKFHTTALISLVALQAAALPSGTSSSKADSKPAAQSSLYSVPIVRREIFHDVKKEAGKIYKKPSTFDKIVNTADKYGEKSFNKVVDFTTDTAKGVKRKYQDAKNHPNPVEDMTKLEKNTVSNLLPKMLFKSCLI
ncbi:hypothetical protein DSO57_1010675 [Entomophthora muscae]|uniref:Uncharacterized protein n=1 Tax=Entomophthora muscae TaxID=34485 RepID=A0ACC2TUN0_9FUNG|nr:hypothetical protein DSO57_1010675 [Entomophthora muscae]